MDLPGFKKDEISAELKDGYLTVSARKDEKHEDKKEGRLIRSERSTGSCSRTFYVGEGVKQGDCSASFADGILTINVPKAAAQKPEHKMIAIQ
jgi:HSP20 family molecular chaperone IbpA